MGVYVYAVNETQRKWFSGHTLDGGAKVHEVGSSRFAVSLVAMMYGPWRDDDVCVLPDPDCIDDLGWSEVKPEEIARAVAVGFR